MQKDLIEAKQRKKNKSKYLAKFERFRNNYRKANIGESYVIATSGSII